MRAVLLERFGGPDGLVDGTLPVPEVAPDDVLIRVKAVSFNPTDYQLRKSGHPSLSLPMVLGRDVAGLVEAVGAAVTTFAIGDEVYANLVPKKAGGYAEFVALPHWFVALKPRCLSCTEAAAVPVTAMTAFAALTRARPHAEKSLLITGGSGGVGSWAIAFAKAFGITRIATTAGSDASRAHIRDQHGIPDARIISYAGRSRRELAAAAIAANDGALFDIALDCVGAAMTHLCCDTVEFGGDVVSVVDGPKDQSHGPDQADEDQLFNRSAAFHCEMISALAYYGPVERHTIYGERLHEIAALIDSGRLRLPTITNLGPLSAAVAREAHRRLESGHTIGKLVATFD
jgi:NADPH:quinone reductase